MLAGTAPVTRQPPGMDRFSLRIWRGNRVTDRKSHLSTPANGILARADEVAVRAAELENRFHTGAEFAGLFLQGIPRRLPSLQKINYTINIIPASSEIPTYRSSGDRFKQKITDEIHSEEISARVYGAEQNTNVVVMFRQPK